MAIEIVPLSEPSVPRSGASTFANRRMKPPARRSRRIRREHRGGVSRQDLSEDQQLRPPAISASAYAPAPGQWARPGGNWDTPFMLVTTSSKKASRSVSSAMARCGFITNQLLPGAHRATLLYSMKLPSWGRHTAFSNMYKVYETFRGAAPALEAARCCSFTTTSGVNASISTPSDITRIRHTRAIFITIRRPGAKRSISAD